MTSLFSTKKFGPGHVLGAGLLALGVAGLVRWTKERRAHSLEAWGRYR